MESESKLKQPLIACSKLLYLCLEEGESDSLVPACTGLREVKTVQFIYFKILESLVIVLPLLLQVNCLNYITALKPERNEYMLPCYGISLIYAGVLGYNYWYGSSQHDKTYTYTNLIMFAAANLLPALAAIPSLLGNVSPMNMTVGLAVMLAAHSAAFSVGIGIRGCWLLLKLSLANSSFATCQVHPHGLHASRIQVHGRLEDKIPSQTTPSRHKSDRHHSQTQTLGCDARHYPFPTHSS